MNKYRRFTWCILLNLTLEDLEKKISISELASNADKTLVNQVNCDVDRCFLENRYLKYLLKQLILSIFTNQKSHLSYIQGVHDIGSVFLMLFVNGDINESIGVDIDSIIVELNSQGHDLNDLRKKIESIRRKLSSREGRMDVCFKTLEKFLLKYSTPFIYKSGQGINRNLDDILLYISEDLLYLLKKSSPELWKLFLNIGLKDDPKSKTFMFVLPWLITWFSHNISLERIDLLFFLYDNFVENQPLYILFFIEEIIIRNQGKLIEFLTIQLNTDTILESSTDIDIYPFIHLYFQNLQISDLLWYEIIEHSRKSFNKSNEKFLKSRVLWEVKEYNLLNNVESNLNYIPSHKKYNSMLLFLFFAFSGIVIAYLVNLHLLNDAK